MQQEGSRQRKAGMVTEPKQHREDQLRKLSVIDRGRLEKGLDVAMEGRCRVCLGEIVCVRKAADQDIELPFTCMHAITAVYGRASENVDDARDFLFRLDRDHMN